MAAPTVVAGSVVTSVQGDGGNVGWAVTVGAGVVSAGDQLVVCLGVSSNGDTLGMPATGTWSEITVGDNAITTSGGQFRAYRCTNPANSTTYTFTGASGRRSIGGALVRGGDGSAFVNVAASVERAAGASHAPPSITTTVNDCLIVDFPGHRQFSPDNANWTPPASGLTWTEQFDVRGADGNNNIQLAMGTAVQATAGAVSTAAWTNSDIFEPTLIIRIAIAPAAGGGNTPQSSTDTASLAEAQSVRLADADAASLAEAQSVRLADANAASLAEAQSVRLADTDAAALADTTLRVSVYSSDALGMTEANVLAAHATDSDNFLTSEVNGVRVSDVDSLGLSESQRPGAKDGDTLTVGDTTYSIRLYDSDALALGESESQSAGGGTSFSSSDAFALSESERVNVRDADALALDDSGISVRVADADVLTLTDTLIRAGLSYDDAFLVAEATAAIAAQVSSGDTFTLVEAQAISGDGGPVTPSSPITVQIGQPAITVKLSTPGITIRLGAPEFTIGLE